MDEVAAGKVPYPKNLVPSQIPLMPLDGGVYRFSSKTGGLEYADTSDDSSDSEDEDDEDHNYTDRYQRPASEGNEGDDPDDQFFDDKDEDEIDHNLLSCAGDRRSGGVVADGFWERRPKLVAREISRPEGMGRPKALKKAQLHPDEKVNEIINETIQTERVLVDRLIQMQAIKKVFQETNIKQLFRENPDIEVIFPELDSVIKLHKENLLPELEREASKSERTSTIYGLGMIFKAHVRFFLHHKGLICQQCQSVATITKLMKHNPNLRGKMNDLMESFKTSKVDMSILFAEPQRKIQQFILLFERYIKTLESLDVNEGSLQNDTSPNDIRFDLQNAKEAYTQMKDVLTKIDDASHKEKMRQELMTLRRKLHHLSLDIMKDGRELRESDTFRLLDPRKDTLRKCQAYLFDDMVLVIRKEKIWCTRLKSVKVDIETGQEDETSDDDDGVDEVDALVFTLVIYGKEVVLELEIGAREVAQLWKEKIEATGGPQDTISFRSEDQHFPLGHRAPRLRKLKSADDCQLCHLVFNRRTKFNCRACGMVVCHDCSKQRRKLTFSPLQKTQRVCEYCASKL